MWKNSKILNIKKIYPKLFEKQFCRICGKAFYYKNGQIYRIYRKIIENKQHFTCCSVHCARVLQMKIYDNPMHHKDAVNNSKRTFMKNYGVDNPNKCRKVREKIEQTSLQRCGYKCNFSSPDPRLNGEATCIERFGERKYMKTNDFKIKKDNFLKKLGVENISQTKYWEDLWSNGNFVDNKLQKEYNTRKINNTSGPKSKSEDHCYELLKSKFNDVIHIYFDKNRYQFKCDFYIPSKDLFIECHFHWTHGGTPFNKDNQEHLKQLEKWRSKNTQFYKTAIYVWTILDPLKLKTFIDNKLNYKIFYTEEEFIEWFDKLV